MSAGKGIKQVPVYRICRYHIEELAQKYIKIKIREVVDYCWEKEKANLDISYEKFKRSLWQSINFYKRQGKHDLKFILGKGEGDTVLRSISERIDTIDDDITESAREISERIEKIDPRNPMEKYIAVEEVKNMSIRLKNRIIDASGYIEGISNQLNEILSVNEILSDALEGKIEKIANQMCTPQEIMNFQALRLKVIESELKIGEMLAKNGMINSLQNTSYEAEDADYSDEL